MPQHQESYASIDNISIGAEQASIIVREITITTIHTFQPEERVALAKLRMLKHSVGALLVANP